MDFNHFIDFSIFMDFLIFLKKETLAVKQVRVQYCLICLSNAAGNFERNFFGFVEKNYFGISLEQTKF